jgi:hypothetical protein
MLPFFSYYFLIVNIIIFVKKLIMEKGILIRIIGKGGLLGACAKMYLNDEEKGKQFINECYEQRHNPSMQEYLGEYLLSDIIKYNNLKDRKERLVNHDFKK